MPHLSVKGIVVVGAALLLTVLRFTLPVRGLDRADVFKDLAHVAVGALIGAWLATRSWAAPSRYDAGRLGDLCGMTAVALTAAELVAAVVR